MMKRFQLILTLAPLGACPVGPRPNAAGVSMGHLHLNVKDVEASKSFFGRSARRDAGEAREQRSHEIPRRA